MDWILKLLAAPLFNTFLEGYKARLAASNNEDRIAVDLAVKAIEAEIAARKEATAAIIAEQGRWWTALPRAVVQYSFAIFVAKCVVWDKVLAWGSTDPLGGDIAVWGGWVMALWFGGRTLEKITSTVASRFGK